MCLCDRFQYPALDNSVSVTILQHKLEKNHPLNSARIVKLGLKNVSLAVVKDVNFGARFDIKLIERDQQMGFCGIGLKRIVDNYFKLLGINEVGPERSNVGNFEFKGLKKHVGSEDVCSVFGYENESCLKGLSSDENIDLLECDCDFLVSKKEDESNCERYFTDNDKQLGSQFNKPVASLSISKNGVTDDCQMPNFDRMLACEEEVLNLLLSKGFVVKRMLKQQLRWKEELEEYEEFELEIPPGSVLLFPSKDAVGVDELRAMDFKVKNLIVLDGTWSKAKRIYKENPWLKLLPHLKLELDKASLYSEVRQQPKAGYLSTIESIVYALKALRDNSKELDNLLDVFESMVVDQRRCKDERLSKLPPE